MELAQGDWEGLLQQEVQTRYPEELAAWRRDPTLHHAPGGESIHDAAVRARAAVDGILAALGEAEPTAAAQPCEAAAAQPGTASSGTTDSHVLGYETRPEATAQPWAIVVAHDGILRLVLARLLDLPLVNYWAFPFGLCNVTVVEIRNGSGRLRAHNLAEHLGPDRA